jgi:hypothetical protein
LKTKFFGEFMNRVAKVTIAAVCAGLFGLNLTASGFLPVQPGELGNCCLPVPGCGQDCFYSTPNGVGMYREVIDSGPTNECGLFPGDADPGCLADAPTTTCGVVEIYLNDDGSEGDLGCDEQTPDQSQDLPADNSCDSASYNCSNDIV